MSTILTLSKEMEKCVACKAGMETLRLTQTEIGDIRGDRRFHEEGQLELQLHTASSGFIDLFNCFLSKEISRS